MYVAEPQFQGQTKDCLNDPEVQTYVDQVARPALEQRLDSNRSVAEQIDKTELFIMECDSAGGSAKTDCVTNDLMGKDPSARLTFIMEQAEEALDIDV